MKKYFIICAVMMLISAFFCSAADYDSGAIRLSLNEKNGSFSLYHASQSSRTGYVSLFSSGDPRTSYIQVIYDNRPYKMGARSDFVTWLIEDENNPGFIFGSYFLRVTQDFTFIKTAGSEIDNGVAMRITLENLSPRNAEAGLRFLLDTHPGGRNTNHFYAGSTPVTSETMITKGSSENWWASRGGAVPLMGSIYLPGEEPPGSVIFANWRRLDDASWRFPFVSGRSFNVFPFHMRDSAVCYYYEPRTLKAWESISVVIVLAAEDENGYVHTVTENPALARGGVLSEAQIRQNDLAQIQRLINQIDALSAGDDANDDEIAVLENTLNGLLLKYGILP